MKKQNFIIIYSIFFVLSLYFIDQILGINYFYKVLYKVALILLSYFIGKNYFKMKFDYLKFKNYKEYKIGILFSILSFISIFIAFFIFKEWIDLGTIKNEFIHKYKLDGIKFFIASFYLVFINAFIEEYFFRGFILFNFKNRKLAWVFSSIMFSIYHLSNFKNWFQTPLVLLIPLFGLFLVGIFFNYLCEQSKDIFHSYIPHLFADLAIVIIGYFIIIY